MLYNKTMEQPKRPEGADYSTEKYAKYLDDLAKWIFLNENTSRVTMTHPPPMPPRAQDLIPVVKPGHSRFVNILPMMNSNHPTTIQRSVNPVRRNRTVDDGSAVWFRQTIEASSGVFTDIHAAIATYRERMKTRQKSAGKDVPSLLKYEGSREIIEKHGRDLIVVLFAAGGHNLIAKAILNKLPGTFSLQGLQDKLIMKRKMPIHILAAFCEYYNIKGILEKTTERKDRLTSATVYKVLKAPHLSEMEIVDLATTI